MFDIIPEELVENGYIDRLPNVVQGKPFSFYVNSAVLCNVLLGILPMFKSQLERASRYRIDLSEDDVILLQSLSLRAQQKLKRKIIDHFIYSSKIRASNIASQILLGDALELFYSWIIAANTIEKVVAVDRRCELLQQKKIIEALKQDEEKAEKPKSNTKTCLKFLNQLFLPEIILEFKLVEVVAAPGGIKDRVYRCKGPIFPPELEKQVAIPFIELAEKIAASLTATRIDATFLRAEKEWILDIPESQSELLLKKHKKISLAMKEVVKKFIDKFLGEEVAEKNEVKAEASARCIGQRRF